MAGAEIFDNREIEAIKDVIERKMVHRYGSHSARNGVYRVDEFEDKAKEITGAKYALAVANGTASLILALKSLGIKPGEEIITTPFTFIATIEAIIECNAVPILGEIDETLSLDPDCLEGLITERTKAIMPVHMFGVAANMDAIMEIANKHNIPVVEDACEVVGGTYKGKFLGTIGLCGTWSFDPNKTLTVGEGGMVLTDSEELYFKMDCYHDHGHVHSKEIERGEEGKYGFGVNYRLSEVQGALGLVALDKMQYALGLLRSSKKKILDAVADTGIVPRPMHDSEGETATHVIFIMPTAEDAIKFKKAAKEAGRSCEIIAENTWHYAKHWEALEEMSGKDFFGTIAPSYKPEAMANCDEKLSRAVMFGLNIIMDDDSIDAIIKAIRAGMDAIKA